MKRLFSILSLLIFASVVWGRSAIAPRQWHYGYELAVAGLRHPGVLLPAVLPGRSAAGRLRLTSSSGKPKIAYSFNPDDDLGAIRRAGFTHVLVSYLQNMPDEAQRRKLDECRQHGLKLIYRLVDLVDRDRRGGSDLLVPHAVRLLRDHPALAAWQTFEETNLPAAVQIPVYRKIKQWDPDHPVITVITNEYSPGWYQRTYSDDAQDIVMIDYYPYKRRYNGWIYIPASVVALRAAQKRPVPIIPVLQASSSAGVSSAEDTIWPPPGGLEKQLNLWWSLGADAGAAFWIWRGSKEYPFVGVADPQAPAYALSETKALLGRIPDGELPFQRDFTTEARSHGGEERGKGQPHSQRDPQTHSIQPTTIRSRVGNPSVSPSLRGEIPVVRIWQPRVNYLKNSGFERGLQGWVGYSERAAPTDQAYGGHGAARLVNMGKPKAMGVGQETDLLVRPNETVTLSCCYRIVRPTTRLQWMIGTTAYPKFGAAAFLDGQERLPAGGWRRASVSVTNATGAPQRITGISVQSNAFTGEALLDNFQLELAPRAEPYSAAAPARPTRLVYHLPAALGEAPPARMARPPRGDSRPRLPSTPSPAASSLAAGWTLFAWSAPEMPPPGDGYACLAALESARPEQRHAAGDAALELRLRVDPARSDPNGWAGALEVATARAAYLRLPMALAPGQPLFWALSGARTGVLTLRAAPAGCRLASVSGRAGAPTAPIHTVSLGSDAAGAHPLNGLTGGARLIPEALSLPAVEQVRAEAGGSAQ